MRRRARLFDGAVTRPVTLLVTFLTLIVVGVIAYARIPLEMMPGGIQSDRLTVIAWNPGASAEENEAKVVRPLEEQIRTMGGIADVYSWSDEDQARIEVHFERGADMDLARAELRDRIERTRPELPDELERVQIWSWNDGDLPLMWFALLHDGQSDRTDYLVETIVQRRLEGLKLEPEPDGRHLAVRDQLGYDPFRDVDGNREADSLGAAVDRGVDSDQ